MKALIQRVTSASVAVEGKMRGKIGRGLVVFIGIAHGDSEREIGSIVEKVTNMRIFAGENGKMDLSVKDISGEILVVSQFTLYGECDRGRRPDFTRAAGADEARTVFARVVDAFQKTRLTVEQGEFQAYMQIELTNDGPVTLMLEIPR